MARQTGAAAPSAASIAAFGLFGVARGALSGCGLSGQEIAGSLLEDSLGVGEVVAFAPLPGAVVAEGAALAEKAGRALHPFGALVVLARARMACAGAEIDLENRRPVGTPRGAVPIAPGDGGVRVFTRVDHRRAAPAPIAIGIATIDPVVAAGALVDCTAHAFALLRLCSLPCVLAAASAGVALLAVGLTAPLVLVEARMLPRPALQSPAAVSLVLVAAVLVAAVLVAAVLVAANAWGAGRPAGGEERR